MLPTSHAVPTSTADLVPQHELLVGAFSDFIAASARLELSYRDLQVEVAQLGLALSERNQALKESLAENRSMRLALEQILDSMPCGVVVVSGGGAICLANPEAARLLGLEPGAMRSLATVLAERGVDLAPGPLGIREDAPEQELSFEGSGGRRWIAVRRCGLQQSAAITVGGETVEAVLTLRDTSARRRMEAERDAARESVALAQVSALLAHEIRNPLASLELFAGLIADSPERRDEWISHLRAGIRSLSGTVNNVLTLHGGGAPAMERLDVAAEARVAVEFIRPLARQANVALCLRLEGKRELAIRGNKSALHQILLNLCSNALRHTLTGGELTVTCDAQGDTGRSCVRLSVSDNGCGIREDHLHRLFEGGFSGSGSTPGLGLAVCDRLMQQHGGTIRVQSRVGQGSTFTLEFPEL
jgi:two-component system sensor histidine kinase FlrB